MVIATLLLALAVHPLHTTMTELTIDDSRHTVRAVVRVFADDLGNAVRRFSSGDAYVASALSVTDARGGVALRACGTRRAGDVLFVCAEGAFSGPARALRLSNSLLCDVFSDQVNVVQVALGAERHSVLFTRGDRMKSLL